MKTFSFKHLRTQYGLIVKKTPQKSIKFNLSFWANMNRHSAASKKNAKSTFQTSRGKRYTTTKTLISPFATKSKSSSTTSKLSSWRYGSDHSQLTWKFSTLTLTVRYLPSNRQLKETSDRFILSGLLARISPSNPSAFLIAKNHSKRVWKKSFSSFASSKSAMLFVVDLTFPTILGSTFSSLETKSSSPWKNAKSATFTTNIRSNWGKIWAFCTATK